MDPLWETLGDQVPTGVCSAARVAVDSSADMSGVLSKIIAR